MERRTAARMMCAELVEVEWKDKNGRRHRNVANLEDISLSGSCVQLDRPIPSGASVSLRLGGGEMKAIVKYCLYRDQSYFIGMEFNESNRWSPELFQPEHMIDPREVAGKVKNQLKKPPQPEVPARQTDRS